MERDHWMSPPLTLPLSPLGPPVRQGEGIARGHFNDPLLRAAVHPATMYFITLPATAGRGRAWARWPQPLASRFLHSHWLRQLSQIFWRSSGGSAKTAP